MAKTISIIGAGGAMGRWFSDYFSKKGFQVTGFDNTNPVAKNIKKAENNTKQKKRETMKKQTQRKPLIICVLFGVFLYVL